MEKEVDTLNDEIFFEIEDEKPKGISEDDIRRYVEEHRETFSLIEFTKWIIKNVT